MNQKLCEQCGTELYHSQSKCPRCGMPTPGSKEKAKRKFLLFVIALAIFCFAVAIWLPRTI